MRFSIRIKFFIVLLAFSLGPMLISRTLMGKQGARVASNISSQTHAEMLEIISADLENNAIGFLHYLKARGQGMSLAVQMLAHQAESILNSDATPEEVELYFASNFSSGGKAPADIRTSSEYVRRVRGGKTLPLEISTEHAAYRLPLEGSTREHLDQAMQLNRLVPEIRSTLKELELASPWLNIGLESGVFATYPGHGFFPIHYDHRKQRWYRKARTAGDEAVWTTPTVDPATRLTIASMSHPIRDENGEFVGAVSLDVPVSSVIDEVSLKSLWSDQIESFMVKYEPETKDRGERLRILAQHYTEQGKRHHWMSELEAETMSSDDPKAFKVFLSLISTESSGVVNLPYKGRDSVWAFASNEGLSFLLIAPNSVVAELPDQMSATVDSLFDDIRDISAMVSGVMLILVGLIAWFGSKRVTDPLLKMAEAAKRLATGDTSVRLDMQTGDERDELITSFNDMAPKLREHLNMSHDFEMAQEVQNMLLPRTKPSLTGYDIAGGIAYCDQTGGDYYDFIEERNESDAGLGVVLGDVSGHGLPSALLMATARGQLHSLAHAPLSPSQRIQVINTVLSQDMDGTGRFLTLFYLRLTADDPVVRWVRAGHDPAIRYTPGTGEFSELSGDGLALGVLGEYEFTENEAELSSGEILVLATDGVWESRNGEGEMFGKERILAIVRENAQYCAEVIRKSIMDAVERYQANGQQDDIAVVVVKKVEDVSGNTISFRMTNKENCFSCFQPKVEAFGEEHGLERKIIFHLTLVLDEIITNIIQYGYADFDVHPIDVTISLKDTTLSIRIEDDAQPFNILEAPEPELDVPLDDRDKPIGGMGVHLVKSMVHCITYERKDGKNVLTLSKDLNKKCTAGDDQS